jgi:hypothetical protein
MPLGGWTRLSSIKNKKDQRKFRDDERLQKSLFRLGLDFIRETLIKPRKLFSQLDDLFRILKTTLRSLEAFL